MNLSKTKSLGFYIQLLLYKLLTPLECGNYRLKVFVNEFTFILAMLGLRKLRSENREKITIRTKFGTLRIRDIDSDIAIASPSYERQDINELLSLMGTSLYSGNHVLFIDAGACFGKYSVAVASEFRRYRRLLTVFAFEPDPENYRLLCANIRLNHLRNVRTFRIALSNSGETKKFYYYAPMKQIVSSPTDKTIFIRTDTLDRLTSVYTSPHPHSLFIKLDVEEHEVQVLEGSKRLFRRFDNTILLTEDSAVTVTQKLHKYLLRNGTILVKKTPYNSFWEIRKTT